MGRIGEPNICATPHRRRRFLFPLNRCRTANSELRFARAASQFSPSMAYDWLKGVADEYDVIVIGSGLGGLTGANVLAKAGHRVLLVEHHYQFGGLATWFTRKGGHIFDISCMGFPAA